MRLGGALFAALLLASCGGDDDDTASSDATTSDETTTDGATGDDGDLDLDLGPDEVVIEQGDDTITSGADFPDDFPVWAIRFPTDFSLLMVQARDVGGVQGWTVLGSVPKPPDQVEFELLGSYGDPDETTTDGGAIRLRFDGSNGLDLVFTLTENDDGDTALTLQVAEA